MKTLVVAAAAFAGLSTVVVAHAQSSDASAASSRAHAQDVRKLPAGTTIPLKDGGRIVIDKNHNTYHQDAAGNRVRMRDGDTMDASDGSRYVMKNDPVWKTLTERGTLSGK